MKSPHLYYILALALLIFLLVQKPQTEIIKVPAVVGNIKPAPITYLEPKGEPLRVIWKDRVIERKNPLNDSLLQAYKDLELKYQDKELELERAQMFIDAITLRDFESTFEDEYLELTATGTVQGYLKTLEISHYEIKEREIEKKGLGINISLSAGYGMTNTGLSPIVGLTISKPLIRF